MSDGTQAAPAGTGEELPTMAEAGNAAPTERPLSGSEQMRAKIEEVRREIAHRDPTTDRLRGNEDGKFKPEPRLDQFEQPEQQQDDDQEYVTLEDVRDGEDAAPEEIVDPEEAPAAAEQETELDAEPAAAEEPEAQTEPLTVTLPKRHENDQEIEVQLVVPEGQDPQVALDRYNQLRNEGMRRQEYTRAMETVEAQRAQLDEVRNLFRNPDTAAEWVVGQMAPEVQHAVVGQMLAAMKQETFEALVKDVAQWSRDPDARRTAALEAENARLKRQTQASTEKREDPGVIAVRDAVMAVIPENVDDRRAGRFFQVAMQEVAQYVQKNRLNTLSGPQAVEVIRQSGLLEDFGLSSTPAPSSQPAAAPAPPSSESSTGKDLASRAEKRKSAAAVAPAGAGASSAAALRFPKGQTVNERIKAVQEAGRKGILRFGRS